MSAALPFTAEQFYQVFAVYNEVLWPAVVTWWLVTLAAVAAAWRSPATGRWLMWLLALTWAWNALVYHAWLFSAINPAAPEPPARLTIIPALWALVGGSAAYLLQIPTDYVLLGAGVLLGWMGIRQRYLSNVMRTSPQ